MIALLAATVAPAMAQEDTGDGVVDEGATEFAREISDLFDLDDATLFAGNNTAFYPWVANDDDFGLGPADTSISVQNVEGVDAQIFIYVGTADGGFELETTAFLAAFAAKSFSAEQLGIESGSGAPVAVAAFTQSDDDDLPIIVDAVETTVILSNPLAGDDDQGGEGEGAGDFTQVVACVINEMVTDDFGAPAGFVVAAPFTFDGVDYVPSDDDDTTEENSFFEGEFTQEDLQAILDNANEGNEGALINPFGGLNNDGDCSDAISVNVGGDGELFNSVAIGGVAKQAVQGANLPTTTSEDTAVSGYNAVNGLELAQFDEWYLPIVQTNCGPGGCWDSVIRVANLNNLNSAVTIRFFPADDGSGSLQTGFQVQESVDGGETVSLNLSDLVPEGWVGSAHVLSDGAVFTMVDRYKVGYNMWVTNTGSSANFENIAQTEGAQGNYALFAPHVLLDYFGWNTGINVANLSDQDNNVSIQYFNQFGNATEVLNQRLAAQGMTYFYDPSQPGQDINEQDQGQDGVPDDGTTDDGTSDDGSEVQQANEAGDPNANVVGSAIIWSEFPVAAAVDATKYPESDPNGGEDLFQGTSYSATQNVFEFQAVPLVQKGSPVDGLGDTSGINIMNPNSTAATVVVDYVNPSGFSAQNFGQSSVTIPGFANGFVYTMTQRNLPNGFTGAAQVVSNLPVAAVSANVNYAVDGDGSAIFNAFNPCGFFRVAPGDCSFGNPFDPTSGSVTKTFVDEAGAPVAGVGFSIATVEGTAEFPTQRDGTSGEEGSLTFENVPAGEYELFVNSVPEGFVLPDGVQETFTLEENGAVELTNVLTAVDDGAGDGSLAATVLDDNNGPIADASVDLFAGVCPADFTTTPDATGTTGADGVVTLDVSTLAAGDYCAAATTDGGVGGDLGEADVILPDDTVVTIGGAVVAAGLVVTATDDGALPAAVVEVDVFVLAAGGTCADLTGSETADASGTTDVATGEVTLSGLAAGGYCVQADFDDDTVADAETGTIVAADGSGAVTIDSVIDAIV